MKEKNDKKIITYDDLSREFVKAKKHIGFYCDETPGVIQISGDRAFDIINSLSCTNIVNFEDNNVFTLIVKPFRFFEEIFIVKLTHYKYLLFTKRPRKLAKILKKVSKKFPITTVNNMTGVYSLLSFHGSDANEYFKSINYKNLYKTKHQNYIYYQLLFRKKELPAVLKHFSEIDFSKISIETKMLFLYNNNVILNLNKIPLLYRDKVCKKLYDFKKVSKKDLFNDISIEKFEIDQQVVIPKNKCIFNIKRKKSGIIYCCYFIPNKRFPFAIGIVDSRVKDTGFIKHNKEEIFIKKVPVY